MNKACKPPFTPMQRLGLRHRLHQTWMLRKYSPIAMLVFSWFKRTYDFGSGQKSEKRKNRTFSLFSLSIGIQKKEPKEKNQSVVSIQMTYTAFRRIVLRMRYVQNTWNNYHPFKNSNEWLSVNHVTRPHNFVSPARLWLSCFLHVLCYFVWLSSKVGLKMGRGLNCGKKDS